MALARRPQPPIRSLLYVPGQRLEWMLKAPKYGADALILDLEDSVPPDLKVGARATVRRALDELGQQARPYLFVRINPASTDLAAGDLEAVVGPGLFGVYLPKCEGPEEAAWVDERLTALEAQRGLP